jgi:hypothetical protein
MTMGMGGGHGPNVVRSTIGRIGHNLDPECRFLFQERPAGDGLDAPGTRIPSLHGVEELERLGLQRDVGTVSVPRARGHDRDGTAGLVVVD